MSFKKIIAGTILTSVVLSGTALAANHPAATKNSFKLPANMYKLEQKTADVTGDKKAEIITLYGQKEKSSDIYNEKLLLVIENPVTKQVTSLPLHDDGYSPKLLLHDLTFDNVADIMVTADTGGSGGYTNSNIYTLKNGNTIELPLPGLQQGKVGLLDGAFIKLQPIDLNKNGSYILQGVERVVGDSNADTVAFVTSNWKWNNGKWEVFNVKVERPEQPVAHESGKSNLYINPQANFSFNPPTSWNGHYKVNQYAGVDAVKILPSAKHVVQFDYTAKDGKDAETLLMISVFSKNDWTRLSSEEGPPVGTAIAESNGMVYVATSPQSNPFDSQSEDGKLFDQLYGELNIDKSFALLK
ncbi:hypothetical protein [Brevibacillus choshinensis]|uniref:hypothetical protein n=1 Tax=Brevibacillus choshinensis TaxID=54911 RepID=UPI002E1CB2EE|nr:hypothetical protein [Brevibacillus choshinensis]